MTVTKAPTEAEIAEAMNSTCGFASDVIRRLAFQRDRLISAIEGKDGWKENVAALNRVVFESSQELHHVLKELDNLAEVWGDEGVFRRCRDRLRDLGSTLAVCARIHDE